MNKLILILLCIIIFIYIFSKGNLISIPTINKPNKDAISLQANTEPVSSTTIV